MIEMMDKIDFVIPWVDGSDVAWQQQRNFYAGNHEKISDAQYRDWGVLKYWFRSVERYAPWVNKIHLVTCDQIPDWLNTDHPQLNCVNHTDYIPEKYLPTFNSNVIELNFHRIPDLAEHFVYFNDDMYINAPVTPKDFFVKGSPCETPILSILSSPVPGDAFAHLLLNDICVINKYFKKREVVASAKKKWFYWGYGKYLLKNLYYSYLKAFSAFHNFHVASSMRKSTFEEVWKHETELLENTCKNKFRGLNDVNQYVMSYYNICKGEFVPRKANTGKFYVIGQETQKLYEDIRKGKHKLICINDDPDDLQDIEKHREGLISVFEQKYPEKSTFEK